MNRLNGLKLRKGCLAILSIILTGCSNVEIPEEQYYQFYTSAKQYFKNDSICIYLNNPISCPLRYYVSSSDSALDKMLNSFKPLTLKEKKDTVLKIAADSSALGTIAHFNSFGDLNKKVIINKISLPFPKKRKYKINQGYNGKYSHNIDDYSRFSIDFNLKTNDTICAADDGIVVGVISDYKYGGDDERLKQHANFITLYHPHSGLFTQYVHLRYKGSLVALDDSVIMGQPIGISGETGFTDGEHLHFSALIPVDAHHSLNSVKTAFIEGYEGENLAKGDRVEK
jgi:murein DD-endopeptidase MepM/ murein hydrolase activator NlpD